MNNYKTDAQNIMKFSKESWFKAGRIFQYIMDNRDRDVLQYGISFNEDVFEICSILEQRINREIKLIPLNAGFSMHLTRK